MKNNELYLKRKAYGSLADWKANHDHKCLMVKGARQVGKTRLVREFGRREYASFIEVNFIAQKELKAIFEADLSAATIYKRMTALMPGIRLIAGNTLIFLDEIQNCGNARTAIKFLAEDGRFDVISSGSLLGLSYAENGDREAEEPESVPTGYEDFLTLYSLDFEEFLWAEGFSAQALDVLRGYFQREEPVPQAINNRYEELLREFIVVGGMPEAVADYAKHHDFNRVARIQERILENYRFDISKHARGAEKAKVRSCYDAVARQLAKPLKKFQYSTVEKGKTSKKYGGSIQWLKDSSLVHVCYNVREPNLPLMGNATEEQFKLYVNDTGLLCAMYGNETKKAVLLGTLSGSAKGGIYENMVAESLVKRGYRLFYHKPNDYRELEFLIEKEAGVVPVEVKAGNTASVSLNGFIADHVPKVAYKFISGNVGRVGCKLTLPHHMVMFV